MTAPALPHPDAEAVRTLLRQGPKSHQAYGRCSTLTDEQLVRLIEHCADSVENAHDALRMRPWPRWMHGVLFPGRTSRP
jgi:hypothetical protein